MNQTVWAFLYRNWTWMGVPVMVVALAGLGFLIAGIVSLVKNAQLLRVPLTERQEVHFAEGGQVILCVEGPRGTTRLKHINFELTAKNEERIEGSRRLFGARTTGFSWERTEVMSYHLPRPGAYVLSIEGLGAARNVGAGCVVVFTRPIFGMVVVHIVGIILTFGAFVTSLVFFVLRLLEKGQGT